MFPLNCTARKVDAFLVHQFPVGECFVATASIALVKTEDKLRRKPISSVSLFLLA